MAKWPRLTWPPQPSSIVRPTPTTAKMTTSDNRNSLPALLKYGSCGTTRPMTTAPTASQTRLWRTSRLVRSDAGTRVTGTSSTAAPDVSNTRAMALPRTSTINRMRTNTASSAFGALDVWADTSWPTSPRIRPPASACGRDTKAPKGAVLTTTPLNFSPIWGIRGFASSSMRRRASSAEPPSLEPIRTVPSSSMSISTPVVAMISLIRLPFGPMTSPILSTGMVKATIRGAVGESSDRGPGSVSVILPRM